jgi:murein DD-endopeptidase MepM/ murein hydrolase activator NlpD
MKKKIKILSIVISFIFVLSGSYYYFNENVKLKKEITFINNKYDSLLLNYIHQKNEIEKLYTESQLYSTKLNNFIERDKTVRNEVLFFTDVEMYNFKNNIQDSIKLTKINSLPYVKDEFETLAKRIYIQSNSYDSLLFAMKANKTFLLSIPIIKPIQTKDLYAISSDYGLRVDPFDKTIKFHEGVDITGRKDASILATGWGRVEDILYSKYGYGNRILINHGYGYKSLYAHLGKIYVRKGQIVKRGQKIATLGSSGRSTGYHLHYEVYKNGTHTDPINHFYSFRTDRSQKFKHLIIIQQ